MHEVAIYNLRFPELSPALVEIFGFPIRWYALAYVAGIMCAWIFASWLIKQPKLFKDKSPITKVQLDDLIIYIVLGIILGGRLGYIFFYQLPFQFERVINDPLVMVRVWEGGMSFHGGFLGVVIAIILFARLQKINLLNLSDLVALNVPFGIFFGRCANFVNAELFGRHTSSPIGMIFPEGCAKYVSDRCVPSTPPHAYDWATGIWHYSGTELPRHASQLYEATLEGLVPAIVLVVLTLKFGLLKRTGMTAGLFILMYGLARLFVEQFREPDSHINFLAGEWLTMGMLLSAPMCLFGVILIWASYRKPQ